MNLDFSWLSLALPSSPRPYNKWTAGGGREEPEGLECHKWIAGGGQKEPGGLEGRKWSAGEGQEELGGIEGHEALKPKMKLKI